MSSHHHHHQQPQNTEQHPSKALLNEVHKGAELEKTPVQHDAAADALARAKIETAVKSGKAMDHLNEVQPPKDGVSDAVKAAYLEDQKDKKK